MPATNAAIRPFASRAECDACVRLQRETWGEDFVDVVPATILMVSQRVGGVSAGAFDADGRLLGFVFGISGIRAGELVHWSDMLAVRPEARGRDSASGSSASSVGSSSSAASGACCGPTIRSWRATPI